MGIPQPSDESTSSSTQPAPTEKPTVSSLPPEALSLATKLFDFARQGQTAELSQYISAGIPVNLTNHKGDTLLMLAAYYGQLDTVKMLLDHGADTEALNERGQSPIAGAVFKGYDDIVKTLFERGAKLDAGHPDAVDCARMFKREAVLEMFGVDRESQ